VNDRSGSILAGRRIGLLTGPVSRLGGGVFEAVALHAELVRAEGGTPVVIGLADAFAAQDRPRFADAEVTACPVRGPRQIGFAPHMIPALLAARLDVLHLHGIWLYSSRAGLVWARKTGRPYVVSPHGMLDPWITARGRWKKALARLGYERASWRRANLLHALTDREAADITRETGRDDAVVIPNAGPTARANPPTARPPVITYLGRIHPKKNVLTLIEAWDRLASGNAVPGGAELVIAGWGERGHVAELEARAAHASHCVRFIGPVHGSAKRDLFAQARFLALPSFSEGLPMAMLEAWAEGVPTLMSSECNLPQGFASGAAIDCGTAIDRIASAMAEALAMPDARWHAMSQAALSLAHGEFDLHTVARRWAMTYDGLMQQAEPQE